MTFQLRRRLPRRLGCPQYYLQSNPVVRATPLLPVYHGRRTATETLCNSATSRRQRKRKCQRCTRSAARSADCLVARRERNVEFSFNQFQRQHCATSARSRPSTSNHHGCAIRHHANAQARSKLLTAASIHMGHFVFLARLHLHLWRRICIRHFVGQLLHTRRHCGCVCAVRCATLLSPAICRFLLCFKFLHFLLLLFLICVAPSAAHGGRATCHDYAPS